MSLKHYFGTSFDCKYALNLHTNDRVARMLKQYNVLTRCITLINMAVLPQIEKLKLEIQLILMKQLLLMQPIERRIQNLAQSEAQFDEIMLRIEDVCSSNGEDAAARLATITAHARAITEELKKLLANESGMERSPQRQDDEKRIWS